MNLKSLADRINTGPEAIFHAALTAFSCAMLFLAMVVWCLPDSIKQACMSGYSAGTIFLAVAVSLVFITFLPGFFFFMRFSWGQFWWYRSPVPYIIVLALSTRVILGSVCFEPYYYQPDSGTYLSLSSLDFAHRCPGYPLLISLLALLVGEGRAELFPAIVVFQSIAGVGAAALFFYSLRLILGHERLAVVFSLFYALLPQLISWERTILTESLAVDMTVLLIFLLSGCLREPKPTKCLVLGLYAILPIFTRPSFLILLPGLAVIFAAMWLSDRNLRASAFAGLTGTALALLCVTGYIGMNGYLSGKFTFSDVFNNNQLAMLIYNKLYHNPQYPEITDFIREELAESGKSGLQAAKNVVKKFGYAVASRYIYDTIWLHRRAFMRYTLKKFTDQIDREIASLSVPVTGWLPQMLVKSFSSALFFFSFGWVWFFTCLEALFLLLSSVLKRSQNLESWFFCYLLLGISVTSIAGGYSAFERLSVCLMPLSVILAGFVLRRSIFCLELVWHDPA